MQIKRTIWIYYATQFFENLSFVLPIYILFGTQQLHFSYSQVAFLYFLVFLSTILCNFGLGFFADSISRKKSFLIGTGINILCLLPFFISHNYLLFVITAVINGIGQAFAASTMDTIVYNSLEDSKSIDQYPHVTSHGQQLLFSGRAIASLLGGFTYVVSPFFPYILQLFSLTMCFVSGIFLVEKQLPKPTVSSFKTNFSDAIKFFAAQKAILYFCIIGAGMSLFADLLFSYYQPYFAYIKVNPIFIGGVYTAISIASAYGSFLSKKLLGKVTPIMLNRYFLLLMMVSSLLLLPLSPWLSLVAPLFMAVASGWDYPNLRYYLNSQSPSHIKTSVISLGFTFYDGGTMVGFLLSGILADQYSPLPILTIVCIGGLITLLCSFNPILQKKHKVA